MFDNGKLFQNIKLRNYFLIIHMGQSMNVQYFKYYFHYKILKQQVIMLGFLL